MVTPNINFKSFIRQLVPFHKLQSNRLTWLYALLHPLKEQFDLFVKYRQQTRIDLNTTFQIKSFEGYLRTKYNDDINIKLVSYSSGGVPVYFKNEGAPSVRVYFRHEGKKGVSVYLRNEMKNVFGDADIIIYIPNTLDIDNVRADIERFKPALVKYKIIQT